MVPVPIAKSPQMQPTAFSSNKSNPECSNSGGERIGIPGGEAVYPGKRTWSPPSSRCFVCGVSAS
ncbi:hypothetical protein MGG_17870 [Pyricularia oryzae 70-15]|uniref:Uncharacterized protein n=4 Tax=Pyricularia oryzae TaxID=318829 RepID=G5EHG9_PYRO7|nr:uncharacterized protein MGG_17870 [Pyricularia oryzae 70-15]ELQ41614.1 hypothetical protein OOU_Y34scaffold00265g7 [Pyricularia oryzae Y34]KAI7916933.1 hypothetical protein M9X92_007611 [Pyricularia oryzae]EAQ71502.1 hypothetical protein MGCH7_ch7g909 [Pyricularia oryzae 70-15]EHA45825.1 hypothetical protein MGG_17870 [Pyricularia oryzae 70-15]KAI7917863.1 hypothetical protein M0657_007865 [Pyricularia oryzae]